MSFDPAALRALATRTKAELRHFELVAFRAAGHRARCFLGIGKHALYFVRRNLGGLYPTDEGGRIFFAFIEAMVEDLDNSTDLVLLLSSSAARSWETGQLFVSSANRYALVQSLQVAWSSDYTFRFGKVRDLDVRKQSLGGESAPKAVPFKGWKQVLLSAYRFFVPESYQEQDALGHFRDPARRMELEIVVHEPVPIIDLETADQNHIRWAALEVKQSLRQRLTSPVITKSSSYEKRNAGKDPCDWMGWEITLHTAESVMAVLLLRRQFVPPLADTAQDFCITVTCERMAVEEGQVEEHVLLEEASFIADSTAANTEATVPQQMYMDFIQAKLDTLLLPESSIAWVEKALKLKPSCLLEARVFMKAILKVLREEHQLTSKVLDDLEAGGEIPFVVSPMEAVARARNLLKIEEEEQAAANAWLARVARYFTSFVNGAFSGFSLSNVCNATLNLKPNQASIEETLLFLLHARPKDLSKKWEAKAIRHLLLDPELFLTFEFNDLALQALLEYGWLARQLRPPKGQEKMSLEFTQFLCSLLVSEASQDLKAAICREITSACSGPIHVGVLVPALSAMLRQHNLFLKTCATVVLMNMTSCHETVKDALIRMELLPILVEHLRVSDDDLIYYTLMLMSNLTRTTAHRLALHHLGAVAEIVALLRLVACTPKQRGDELVAEMAANVGQLCNEQLIMNGLAEAEVVSPLIKLYEWSPPGSRQRAKLIFALRQLWFCTCEDADEIRQDIGRLLPDVIQELNEIAIGKPFDTLTSDQRDCLVSSVLLLHSAALSPERVEEMRRLDLLAPLMKLRFSPLKDLDPTRERIVELWDILKGER